MGGLAAGGALGSAAIQKSSANKAGELQKEYGTQAAGLQRPAADEANAILGNEFARSMEALKGYQPYETAGTDALSTLMAGLQDGGEFNRMYTAEDFKADPGYDFTRREGLRALDRSAAANTGVLSGAALKSGMRYATGLADNTFENAFQRYRSQINDRASRLGGMVNTGLGAMNTRNSLGQQAGQFAAGGMSGNLTNAAAREGEMLTGIGNSQAASQLAGGNAVAGGINSGINSLNQFLLLSQLNKPPAASPTTTARTDPWGEIYT